MSKQVAEMNPDMSKRFLEKERKVGKMMAIISASFFLVYAPTIVLRKV